MKLLLSFKDAMQNPTVLFSNSSLNFRILTVNLPEFAQNLLSVLRLGGLPSDPNNILQLRIKCLKTQTDNLKAQSRKSVHKWRWKSAMSQLYPTNEKCYIRAN